MQVIPELVIPGTSGSGIRVGAGTRDWCWRDIIGKVVPDYSGVNAPSIAAFIGGVRAFQYASADKLDCVYHIPHDYIPGTDIHLHLHWGHNAAAISGNFVADIAATYAAREAAAPFSVFSTPVAPQIAYNTLDITNFPQYCHVVTGIQLSAASPSATQLDADLIEVVGLGTMTFTYNGTLSTDPFIFTGDIHYQSSNVGTVSKDPGFHGTS